MRTRIDLRGIEAFVTAAREGSVSRAAAHLNLSQPAVSLQLRRLSQETGLSLFTRTPHGVELTSEGRALLPAAERVMAGMADLARTAQRLSGAVRGRLQIGTIIDPAFIRLGALLAGMVESAPDLETRLVHGISGDGLACLLREDLDIAFFLGGPEDIALLAGPAGTRVSWLGLTGVRYRVLGPAQWQSRLQGLGWAQLAGLPWICTPRSSVHHRLMLGRLAPLGLTQTCATEADQEASMLALVRQGVGLCLAREELALHERQVHGLSLVPDLAIDTELAAIWLTRRGDEPPISLARQILSDLWRVGGA